MPFALTHTYTPPAAQVSGLRLGLPQHVEARCECDARADSYVHTAWSLHVHPTLALYTEYRAKTARVKNNVLVMLDGTYTRVHTDLHRTNQRKHHRTNQCKEHRTNQCFILIRAVFLTLVIYVFCVVSAYSNRCKHLQTGQIPTWCEYCM